jgi:hypothetical protein
MLLKSERLDMHFGRSESNGVACQDNRLALFDQATFLSLRATGRGQLIQTVWVYEHPVDLDGLLRFYRNGGYGFLGRRIERSPLPFGRHRWVSAVGQRAPIDFAERVRPRAQLSDWADERAQLPVDPEWGPGWHMGVARFTDGSTAVSVVISHCLADGIAGLMLIFNAVTGNLAEFGYPSPRSRTRRRAAAADLRETVRGLPEVARALRDGVKMLARSRRDAARPAAARPDPALTGGADCTIVVPAVQVYNDVDDWDARAKDLGGNSYSLFAGVAAKLGEYLGRLCDDGTVPVLVPYSDRTLDDTRAIAMSYAKVSVDPTKVTTDLSDLRLAIRQELATAREASDPALKLLALTPFVPKRAVTALSDLLFGFGDSAVLCSNLGDLPPELVRADGTDAELVLIRGVDQGVTRGHIERIGGQLVVAGGRLGGRMTFGVVAYQPGGVTTKPQLRELVTRTLAEFGLSGVVD